MTSVKGVTSPGYVSQFFTRRERNVNLKNLPPGDHMFSVPPSLIFYVRVLGFKFVFHFCINMNLVPTHCKS